MLDSADNKLPEDRGPLRLKEIKGGILEVISTLLTDEEKMITARAGLDNLKNEYGDYDIHYLLAIQEIIEIFNTRIVPKALGEKFAILTFQLIEIYQNILKVLNNQALDRISMHRLLEVQHLVVRLDLLKGENKRKVALALQQEWARTEDKKIGDFYLAVLRVLENEYPIKYMYSTDLNHEQEVREIYQLVLDLIEGVIGDDVFDLVERLELNLDSLDENDEY